MTGGPNLRNEFWTLVTDEGLGRWVHVRRHIPNTSCECMNHGSQNPSPDCQVCYGRGLLWKEWPAQAYSRPFGNQFDEVQARNEKIRNSSDVFYFHSRFPIKESDLVVEVKRSTNTGQILSPVSRLKILDVNAVQIYSSDRGIPEYLMVYCTDITKEVMTGKRRG